MGAGVGWAPEGLVGSSTMMFCTVPLGEYQELWIRVLSDGLADLPGRVLPLRVLNLPEELLFESGQHSELAAGLASGMGWTKEQTWFSAFSFLFIEFCM